MCYNGFVKLARSLCALRTMYVFCIPVSVPGRPRHEVLLTRSDLCTLALPPRSRHCRGCDESRSILTSSNTGPYIPPPNCDARNSFRIRFYENCRVSPTPSTLSSTSTAPLYFHTLSNSFVLIFMQNARGVPPTPGFLPTQSSLRVASRPLAFSSPMYSIYAALDGLVQPRATRGFQRTHDHARQRSKPPGHAAVRLPVPLRLQHQPQDHRPQLSLARAIQRFSWHGDVAAHAYPSGVAGCASPVSLHPRQLPGPFCRSHNAPWFIDGFSGAHRGAPGRLWKLFSSAANRRTRSGLPHAEPHRVLGHGGLVPGHDRRFLNLAPIGNHALDRQRCHLLRGIPPQRAQFQRHHHRSPRSGNDAPPAPVDRLGLVHQCHPGDVDFQHSSGGLRLLALGSPFEHALFPPVVSPCQSAGRRCHKCSLHPLAAPLLVFRASRSLHRHASVFRPRHASDFHVFSQTGLERTPRGSGAVRCGRLRFLRLGPAHVFQRHESVFAAGLFAFGLLPRTARYDPAGQLARHTLERAHPAQHRNAFHARLHFTFSLRRTLRHFPRPPRSRRRCRQRRFRHRPFPSRHGRRGHVCHSWRTVFLVPQTFWPPPERTARQTPFLDYLCRRLLRLHADALARLDRPFTHFPRHPSGFHRCRRLRHSHLHHRRHSSHGFRARALPHQFSLEPLPRRKGRRMQPVACHHTRLECPLAAARR